MLRFPNAERSGHTALLCIFEDNDCFIKMILKVWILTVRHVSYIHRVALDWLFDRIKLDPMIQVKIYIYIYIY